jgi:uncharacterized membrane protein YeaQ/YmgE (transglycosylase-associated protein family)
MNTNNTRICLLVLWFVLSAAPCGRLLAAEPPTITDRAKQAVSSAGEAVQEAGRSVGRSVENLWRRMDENRLQNRTRDEIVAWVIMGVLAGAVAGMMTSLKTGGLGKAARLLLGLLGAFLGGMIVRVAQLDLGWGPVLIRYEELFFSLLGAVALIVSVKLLRASARKKAD